VRLSRSPRRVGGAARPRDTCGRRARARPVAPSATTRARPPTRGAGRAITTASRRRAMGGRMQPRGARTHGRYTPTGSCNPMETHNHTHMRSQRHACTHGRARTHAASTHANEHTHNRAHAQTHTLIARTRTCSRTYSRSHAHAHLRSPSRTQHTHSTPQYPHGAPWYPSATP
jgi:hypothetical protein